MRYFVVCRIGDCRFARHRSLAAGDGGSCRAAGVSAALNRCDTTVAGIRTCDCGRVAGNRESRRKADRGFGAYVVQIGEGRVAAFDGIHGCGTSLFLGCGTSLLLGRRTNRARDGLLNIDGIVACNEIDCRAVDIERLGSHRQRFPLCVRQSRRRVADPKGSRAAGQCIACVQLTLRCAGNVYAIADGNFVARAFQIQISQCYIGLNIHIAKASAGAASHR